MKQLVWIAAGAVLLTGCNVGPKYKRPVVPAPPAFRGADEAQAQSVDSFGDKKWSEVFQEPELQTLIDTALKNNFDVRIAAQRILEAEAQVRITRAQQFPTLGVGGSGVGAALPSALSEGSNAIASPLAAGSFNLSAAWTPDFWGLYRRQTEAARDQMLAQTWAQRAVKVTLVQQVVTTYLQLRALDRQLEVSRDALKTREDSTKLTRTLESGGSVAMSDVRQAEQLLYTAGAQIPQLEQQREIQENALRLLLGQDPGPVAHTAPNALAPPPQDVPVGVPSQLLERRPDIQQVEAQLMAANAQIGVARAQFFPQLSITASAGVGGTSFSDMFTKDSKTIYGIGQLTQPIFAGGKLRGQLELSQRQKEELVINYQKTIEGAFRDVSNALITLNKQRAYREQQEKLAFAAKDATRLARIRYQGGAAGYLEVLTTDSNSFTAELQLVSAQQQEATALVQLYSALGGGWQ